MDGGDRRALDASWRAHHADEALRRAFPEPGFDDSDWAAVPVPGHWRSSPTFAADDGPLLYRTSFEAPPVAGAASPDDGERWWLTFDGVFYQADVWLDGSYLGDSEGYFFPHTFEVTAALAERAEHLLAVEVACPPEDDRSAKRNITGVFQHSDHVDPDWNPGGIWRPVILEPTGAVRISRLRVLCGEASAERAVVSFLAVLDAAASTTVRLRTTVGAVEHVQEQPLATGENRVQWSVTVESPALWWPHAMGDQPLHEATVEIAPADRPTATSDRARRAVGLRQVRMARWVLSVNGERLFLKGSSQGPTRMQLAEATADDLDRNVVLATSAGLDLLRVHGHVSRPELYDAADRHGLLLWQDLPLHRGYARGIRKEAARQAREAVDLLGHHPSIVLWCGHDEPVALEPGPDEPVTATHALRFAARQELPGWNKTVLDRTVKRALEGADGTRPVIAHSGVLPHPGSRGTDSHLWFGWYHGDERDLPGFLARLPRLARFVGGFGAQAVPATVPFMEPERWPDLDWERLGRTHGIHKARFDRHVPPAGCRTFADWQQATQAYQATVIRHHVEALRRLKYRPTGGFAHFCLADGRPAVSWSVVDHAQVPKAGYEALADACAPVIVTADRPAPSYHPGQALALDVHVVSDLRTAIDGARVDARLRWAAGASSWVWEGDVPADSCARVGMVRAVLPDAPGPLVLELDLEAGDVKATNRYESEIRPA